jgi:hypothetical protein
MQLQVTGEVYPVTTLHSGSVETQPKGYVTGAPPSAFGTPQPPASMSLTGSQAYVVTGGAPQCLVDDDEDAQEHPMKQPFESKAGEHPGRMQSPVAQPAPPPVAGPPPAVPPDPPPGGAVDAPEVDPPGIQDVVVPPDEDPPFGGAPGDGPWSETWPPQARCVIPMRAKEATDNFMESTLS